MVGLGSFYGEKLYSPLILASKEQSSSDASFWQGWIQKHKYCFFSLSVPTFLLSLPSFRWVLSDGIEHGYLLAVQHSSGMQFFLYMHESRNLDMMGLDLFYPTRSITVQRFGSSLFQPGTPTSLRGQTLRRGGKDL